MINLDTQEGIKVILYPDNQPHVNIPGMYGLDVDVTCSLTDSVKILQLLEASNALDNQFANKKRLFIPYLMGARFDRIMQTGDSFDLKVISDLINSMKFEKVYLFDVHSDVSMALINNSIHISNAELVRSYQKEKAVLICPDAGAAKKISKYFEWNKNIVDIVYCIKNRDLSNGNLTIQVLEPEKCKGRNCIIIDDICDGGGTFLGISGQIKPKHLTLVVTHAIFSKGLNELDKKFDEIIISDSYPHGFTSPIIKTIKVI